MKRLINVLIIPWKYILVLFCLSFVTLLFPGVKEWFSYHGVEWIYIFLLSFLIAYISVPMVRRIAIRLHILDNPDQRKVHKTPTPLLGGVAVYIAFAGTIFYNDVFSRELKGVAIGATVVFLTGLIDDIRHLSATLKLFVQVIAVSIMICYGVVADFLPNVWWGHALEIAITFLWMLGIINSLNFFDGLDGLATGLTAICSLMLGILAIHAIQPFLMFLSIALAGSSLGFLPYNFRYRKPALIFLGDAGSTFMGFMLAGMVIMGDWGQKTPIKAYAMPILIMGIFIFDMIYTTVSRISSKRVVNFTGWLEFAGKDHLHHRIMGLGLSNKQTVFFIYFLTASLGLGALVLKNGSVLDALLLLLQAVTIYLIIVILMIRRRKREEYRLKIQKLESLGDFASNIAHDLNSLSTVILRNIAMVKSSVHTNDMIYEKLSYAEKASLKTRGLASQLLTFSKDDVLFKTTVSIVNLIINTVNHTSNDSHVKYSIGKNIWPVEVDEEQMGQAISNAIFNASQAMPKDGTIEIKVDNINPGRKEALPLKRGRYVKIIIKDNGTGISPEHLQKIFDPFFTTKENSIGLGLAITDSIVRKHDGYITVKSVKGIGSTFYIYLPASDKEISEKKSVKKDALSG